MAMYKYSTYLYQGTNDEFDKTYSPGDRVSGGLEYTAALDVDMKSFILTRSHFRRRITINTLFRKGRFCGNW
jgi:hypothetical protein